jgi:hypothetical protein
MQPKLKAHQSKWNKWKIIQIDYKWDNSNWKLYKIFAHSQLDNGRKTQHKSTERVVPHYME